MSFKGDFSSEIKRLRLGRELAGTLAFMFSLLLDFLSISLLFSFAWLFGRTIGHLLAEDGVSLFWMRVKFIDVVAWGDLGTAIIFILKSLVRFARSKE